VNLPRKLGLATTALVAATALASCGFNYPTDRIYTPAAGSNYRDGTVDILNAAIVSKQPNAGTLVASFDNGSTTKTVQLTQVSGDGSAVGLINAKLFKLAPGGFRNLAAKGGVPLNGSFQAGQWVTLTFQFSDGESIPLAMPVVPDTGQWKGIDHSTPSPTASASPTTSPATPSASTTVLSPSPTATS
jgi:hypothetical protein